MVDPENLQALVKVSAEADESHIRLSLVDQVIRAQHFIAQKLRKESQRSEETNKFIHKSNLQIETEIRNAEQEISSLAMAYETMKSGNIEFKKELLLARHKKAQITERIKKGERKYELIWLECKERYESLPFVQKWLEANKKSTDLKEKINSLDAEHAKISKEIRLKREEMAELDKKQILRLAEYFVHELPKYLKNIKEKSKKIEDLKKDLAMALEEQDCRGINLFETSSAMSKLNLQQTETKTAQILEETWLKEKSTDMLMMPKLELATSGVDLLSVKLEINKVLHASPNKRPDSEFEKTMSKRSRIEERMNNDYFSTYFTKPPMTIEDVTDEVNNNKAESFSNRKLINILEDVTLDNSEAFHMVSRVNIDQLQEVDVISANKVNPDINTHVSYEQEKMDTDVEPEDIEVIDLTNRNTQNILVPPTQFTDEPPSYTQEVDVVVHMTMNGSQPKYNNVLSQPKEPKKKVSFEVPMAVDEIPTDKVTESVHETHENETNEIIVSQMDTPITEHEIIVSQMDTPITEQNYTNIKDMILKKHHLDLSPQFVYAKNPALQKKMTNEVTSKFFDNTIKVVDEVTDLSLKKQENVKITEIDTNMNTVAVKEVNQPALVVETTNRANDNTVSGLLFSHGPQGLPESLDVSLSTTGFEEGEFPSYLDSSLLLSPKADENPTTSANAEPGSQEIPNFLSGFRRGSLSFFGRSAGEEKPDSSAQNPGSNFSFNFGQEKKNKGGLFSFFH